MRSLVSRIRSGARRIRRNVHLAELRNRRLLMEQFEDRRLLATAFDDSYSTPANEPLNVGADGAWNNDWYYWSWEGTETGCTDLQYHEEEYWEDDVFHNQGDHCHAWGDVPVTLYASGGIVIESGPENGILTPTDRGARAFIYEPDHNFVGVDSFTYWISDYEGSSTATVTIEVTSQGGEPPDAVDDAYTAQEDTELTISVVAGLLLNDTGYSLSAALFSGPYYGTVSVNTDGSFSYTPSGDFNGQDSFSYTLTNGYLSDTATAIITVNPVNDAPVLSGSNNFSTISADQTSNAGNWVSTLISGYVSDVDSGAVDGIAVYGLNSGTGTWQYSTNNGSSWTNVGTVSASSALLLSSSDKLRIVPDGQNGTSASVTFRAWDRTSGTSGSTANVSASGGTTAYSSAAGTANITVHPVNLAPTLNAISDPLAINEDAGAQTVSLSGITAGGAESQVLTVTATSNNTSLIPNPTVTYTSPNSTGSLSYTPVVNQSGSATITVTVRDTGSGGIAGTADDATIVRTVIMPVNPVNDSPTLNAISNPISINMNSGLQTISFSGVSAGGGESQSLTVTATSSNTGLIPNPTVTYTSASTTGSLSYTPVANQSGTSTVTVTVRDAGLDGTAGNADDATVVRTFSVTVNATPTLDTISPPAAISEDAGAQSISLGGITAGGGESQAL